MTQPQPHEHRGEGAHPTGSKPVAKVGLLAAFGYPFRGARMVYRAHPELARYWVPPIVLAAIAMAGATWAVLEHRDPLFELMWPAAQGGDGFVDTVVRGTRAFVRFVMTALAVGIGFVVALFVAQVVAAPFHDVLSQAVEALHVGGKPPSQTLAELVRDAARSVQLALVKLAIYFAWMLPLWLLGMFVPVVGPLAQAVLGMALTVAFLAVDHLDWAAARHGLSVSQRLRLVLAYPGPLLAFGLCVWCFLFIPIVNLFLIPAAVAGGTLLFIDLGIAPQVRAPLAKSQHSARGKSETS